MNHDKERDVIRAAMDRLLAGTPLRSDGALTVVALAAEADVKRHVLTHRHTDLKDEFYAKIRAKDRIPDSERKLREQLKKAEEQLANAVRENKRLHSDVDMFARIVNVLEVENDRLRGQQASKDAAVVVFPGPLVRP